MASDQAEPAPRHAAAGALATAVADLVEGARRWQLWSMMARMEIRRRYRRTWVGPLWTTLSMALIVLALGPLYAKFAMRPFELYVPHLTLGLIVWTFIANAISSACQVFVGAARYLKETGMPLSVFVYRDVHRQAWMMLYHMAAYVAVAAWFGINPGGYALLAIPGLALLMVNAVWVGLLIGVVSARFRDIQEMVPVALRLAFFLTPIIWMPDMLGRYTEYLHVNPFYHYIEVVRAPLLGHAPHLLAWPVTLAITAAGGAAALALFGRLRWRVVYWV